MYSHIKIILTQQHVFAKMKMGLDQTMGYFVKAIMAWFIENRNASPTNGAPGIQI